MTLPARIVRLRSSAAAAATASAAAAPCDWRDCESKRRESMGRSNGRCNGGVDEDGFGEDGGVGVSEDGSTGSDIKRSGFAR